MQSGKLDQKITIHTLVEANSGGEITRSYTLLGNFFAHVKSSKGKEAIEAARMNAKEVIRVLVRDGIGAITVRDRITWNSNTYNIYSVDRTNRRKGELWLTAECLTKI